MPLWNYCLHLPGYLCFILSSKFENEEFRLENLSFLLFTDCLSWMTALWASLAGVSWGKYCSFIQFSVLNFSTSRT